VPDVVIVGGGIIGAASAYELARRGAGVTLIERDELAAGASGRNQGWFVLSSDPALGPMSRASLPMYEDVIDTSPVPVRFDREPRGHLILASTEAGVPLARDRAAAWQASGVRADRLDAAAMRSEEPELAPDLAEVWLLDHGRRIDPGALTVALALAARALGADVRTHLNVRTLTGDRERVTGVVTDDGIVSADLVVLAAGPWSAALTRALGFDLPVTGARGWIVELSGPPGLVRRMIEEEDGTWGDEHPIPTAGELAEGTPREPGVSALLHQSPDHAIVCGASHHAALRGEPEDVDAPSRVVRRAIRVVPALADLPVRGIRWGIRPMTPDVAPIVGRLCDGLLAATGHGPEGILLGGGTAALVGAIVFGEDPPFDAAPFDPFRF
jgi:glycine/D-amino acid oxidase-like deaminating enzyme